MVSLFLGVWNGGGCAAVVLPSTVVWLVPCSSIAVLASTAVMSRTVPCQVCGVGVRLWCSCGGVSSVCSPLVVVVGGAVVDGGAA